MSKIMYYFSTADRRLRYDDNRHIVCGETHVVDIATRRLVLCAYGLHASPTPFQALAYAPGPILWKVRRCGSTFAAPPATVKQASTRASARRNGGLNESF